jgi:predicted DCC family thiol-disulfide oxidoreductase YuxK
VTDGPPPSRRDPGARPVTVVYDGECPVCRLTIRALRILDWRRRLGFTALQGFQARALHVRDDRGRWHSGGDAALHIAGAVPVLVPLSLIGRLPGLDGPVEAAYRLVADHRHAIGRMLGIR